MDHFHNNFNLIFSMRHCFGLVLPIYEATTFWKKGLKDFVTLLFRPLYYKKHDERGRGQKNDPNSVTSFMDDTFIVFAT